MKQGSTIIKYPIGVQDFETLRKVGFLYIDKTELMYKLVDTGRYYFLSRPRRFGKSLLVSTPDAYFRGKKELFNGLAIKKLEENWTKHPVLHLDLNTSNYDSKDALIQKLEQALDNWQEGYGIQKDNYTFDLRFENLVMRIHKKYGERVAILIDEYDKPLRQNINRPELQEDLRAVLRSFYSVIKTKDYIYIIEIKLDGSVEEALKQIEECQYAAPYASDERKLFMVDVNFASDIRGVKEWKILKR